MFSKRVGRRTKSGKAALLAGAVLAGVAAQNNSAHATLTINLAFNTGATQMFLASVPANSNITIRVYATVTGSAPSSVPANLGILGSYTSTQSAPLGNSHDGLQYCYYSVLSSVPGGETALGGNLLAERSSADNPSATSFNLGGAPAMYFGGEGSQGGLLQEINGDGILDVGDKSQTAGGNATNWVKPRSATAVWDDANYDTGTSDASGHEVYQYVSSPNIIIGRSSLVPGTTANSVSFYLGLMQYHVTSATLGHGVEFSPVVPTFTDLGGLVPANWWESNPDENQQNGTQVPNTSGPNGTSTNYLAGTSVEILGLSTINPFPPHTIIALTNASGGTVFGTLLTNAASPTAGSATATFNPNAPLANRINVLGSNGSYVPGYANNVGGGDTGGGGDATDTVEATGWNPATDTEIYAMKLLVGGEAPTPAQINRIISDINNSNNGLAVTASGNNGALAGLFSGYQILISTSGVGATGDEYLAWDFSLETNVGGVTVEDIAAIPEPSSALFLLAVSAGMLGRRRVVIAAR